MKIEFSDNVNVSDSKIRGVVSASLNGKHLFTKENTIVVDGRKYIMESFLHQFIGEDEFKDTIKFDFDANGNYSAYQLEGLFLGTGSQSTSLYFTANDFQKVVNSRYNNNPNEEYNFAYFVRKEELLDATTVNLSNKTITFKCSLQGDEDNPATIQELGIFLGQKDTNSSSIYYNTNEKLFSRLVFDPVVLGAGSSFDLEYTIYF